MTRVDLEAFDIAAGYCPDHAKELIWDAIAELRAAREVVEAVRGTYLFGSAAEALAAYDRVATP